MYPPLGSGGLSKDEPLFPTALGWCRGSGNVQTVSIDVDKLNLAIDHSKAEFAEEA